jgi:hypothetical protein
LPASCLEGFLYRFQNSSPNGFLYGFLYGCPKGSLNGFPDGFPNGCDDFCPGQRRVCIPGIQPGMASSTEIALPPMPEVIDLLSDVTIPVEKLAYY